MDLVPNLIIIFFYSIIININYKEFDAFPDLLLSYVLSALCFQSIGYLVATLFGSYYLIGSFIVFSSLSLFTGTTPTDRAFPETTRKLISCISPVYLVTKHILVLFYGFDRCSNDEISSVMYRFLLSDDDFDKSTHLLISLVIVYYILSYICFKIKFNWNSFKIGASNLRT